MRFLPLATEPMLKLSVSALLVLAVALGTGLAGCAEAQRMIDDANRTATTAGTVTTTTASWSTKASDVRGQGGTFAYDCPANPSASNISVIWGSGPYTDDSSVCGAAVHAGAITTRSGGRVSIQTRPGQNRYTGSTRNGISTRDYGSWGGSFVVL